MFKPGTSWANSRGELRDVNCRVMYVTETDPIMARPVSADHGTLDVKRCYFPLNFPCSYLFIPPSRALFDALSLSTNVKEVPTTSPSDKENGARAVSSNIKQPSVPKTPAPATSQTKPAPSTAQKAPLATQKSATSSTTQKATPPVAKQSTAATAKQCTATTTKQSSSTAKPSTSSAPSPAEDKTSSKIQTKIDGEYGKAAAFFILTTKVVLFFLRQRTGTKSDEVLSIYFSTVEDTTEISSALQCLIRYTSISKRATPDLKDIFDGICALGVEAGKEIQPLLLPKSDKVLKESTSGKSDWIRDYWRQEVRQLEMRYRNTIYKCCTTEPCSMPYSIIVEHEIYRSEEPYTKLECDMKCELYYHQTCIKSLPKWNIDEPCLTPDCTGFVRRHYENGQLKRESKIVRPPPKEKKPRERVRTCSEKGKKKEKKKRNNSVPTPSPPTPDPPRTPTPTLVEEEAPSSSPSEEEATFTGDDMVEFYGTLLIYVGDEAPGVFITDAVMKFSYIYKHVKIDTFTDTLWGEIGVESLVCKDGKLFVINPIPYYLKISKPIIIVP
eukprot:sb/3463574/